MFTERASVLAKCPECGNDILIDQVWQSSKGDMNPIDYFCCEKTNDGVSTR